MAAGGTLTGKPEDQWRIDNAGHLKGLRLQFRRWTRRHPDDPWDHDHCAGCWVKFAEVDAPDIHHEGFTTREDYRHGAGYEWICRQCFDDLKADMQWTAADENA